MIAELLDHFQTCTLRQATAIFLLGNFGIFMGSVVLCWVTAKLFARKQIFEHFEPIRASEVMAALSAVVLNAAISVVGWKLWTMDWIHLRDAPWWGVLLDTLAMVIGMDIAMYFSHRLAHHPWLYPWIHRFHHRHRETNPLSLFVLHPLEVFGFGSMMILFLMLYPMSPLGLILYLNLNVLFGTIGHAGVEPLPGSMLTRIPLLNLLGTSTFHAEHHADHRHNFGFYTLIWDWLLGTLSPDYWQQYADPARWRAQQQGAKSATISDSSEQRSR